MPIIEKVINMYAKNKYELSRGFIISSIVWLGIFLFFAIWNIQSSLYWWVIPKKVWSRIIFVFLALFEVYWVIKILMVVVSKLIRNRFKYFPNDRIDNITSKNEKE